MLVANVVVEIEAALNVVDVAGAPMLIPPTSNATGLPKEEAT